jgi:hypothetical protein
VAEATTATLAHSGENSEKARFHAADVTGNGEPAPAVTLAMHSGKDDLVISAPFAADPESNSEATPADKQPSGTHGAGALSGNETSESDRKPEDDRCSTSAADTVTRRPGLLKRAFSLFRRRR